MSKFLIAALYKFVALSDFANLQGPIQQAAKDRGIMGTILLADEGINGTISGGEQEVRAFLAYLRNDQRMMDLDHKESWAEENPFYRMKVRLKKEIVALGVEGVSPTKEVGTYIEPEHWNDLISDPDVIVIDTRNDYEVEIGTFKGAMDPKTKAFRDFPEWFRQQKNLHNKTKIAMFCTGGIRCEKSTSFLKSEGFEDVYHLNGGILKYLETVPEEDSLWEGDCFVFDQRVSVGHNLEQGPYDLCHACRHPITIADKQSEHYLPGVSCPKCHNQVTDEQRQRFAERQRQIVLAKARGVEHIAADQKTQREAKKQWRKEQAERSNKGVM